METIAEELNGLYLEKPMSYKGTSLVYKLSFDASHFVLLNTTHHFKHCKNMDP